MAHLPLIKNSDKKSFMYGWWGSFFSTGLRVDTSYYVLPVLSRGIISQYWATPRFSMKHADGKTIFCISWLITTVSFKSTTCGILSYEVSRKLQADSWISADAQQWLEKTWVFRHFLSSLWGALTFSCEMHLVFVTLFSNLELCLLLFLIPRAVCCKNISNQTLD